MIQQLNVAVMVIRLDLKHLQTRAINIHAQHPVTAHYKRIEQYVSKAWFSQSELTARVNGLS